MWCERPLPLRPLPPQTGLGFLVGTGDGLGSHFNYCIKMTRRLITYTKDFGVSKMALVPTLIVFKVPLYASREAALLRYQRRASQGPMLCSYLRPCSALFFRPNPNVCSTGNAAGALS